MAIQSISIPRDAARDARAKALVPQVKLWHTVTLKQPYGSFPRGAVFFQTPKGYRVNAVVCTCPDYANAGNICKHLRAVVLADQAKQTPKPKPAYADLFMSCKAKGCDNDPEHDGDGYCWRHVLTDAF